MRRRAATSRGARLRPCCLRSRRAPTTSAATRLHPAHPRNIDCTPHLCRAHPTSDYRLRPPLPIPHAPSHPPPPRLPPLPCVPLLGAQPGIPRRDGQCVEACRRVGEELARCLQGACVERTRGGGASAWDRVFSPPDFCTQALTLLEYLLRNGSERSVEDARDHMYQLRTMCDFQYVEAGGVDQGTNGARGFACHRGASDRFEPATAEARTVRLTPPLRGAQCARRADNPTF